MKIKIICFGKIKDSSFNSIIDLFSKRIKTFINFEIIELNEIKICNENNKNEIDIALKKEKDILKRFFENSSYNIICDINSQEYDSIQFSKMISNLQNKKIVSFYIGSSHGFDDEIKQKADLRISFSKLTFNHQIFRIILLEQIYRGFTIIKNIKYHK